MQIKSTMIVPFRLYELLSQNRIVPERFCPDNRFYVADHEGRIHSFMYGGTAEQWPQPPPEEDDEESIRN